MDQESCLRFKHSGLPLDIQGAEDLVELALNLSWSWNHSTHKIWSELEPALWKFTHNPWIVLKTVSRDKLQQKLTDPDFRNLVDQLVKQNREEADTPGWFQKTYPNSPLTSIAYFSMEYMLTEALPIYSGGLGNVAGDQMKAASDLGVPVSAIGLLYQQGYFRQVIDKDGAQQALYPFNDPGQLPITPVRKPDGEWLRMEIKFPGWSLWVRAWQAQVGRVKLYLLDSNDAVNLPAHRGITSELYGGGTELRLKQEMLLGICGWRLLEALGIKPEICHLNEGHAAFAVLERAKSFMEVADVPFNVALEATRAGNLFTTHTAVPAGFDRFSPALMEQYFAVYAKNQLGISFQDLMALGRENPSDANEYFTTAYLAIRGSGAVNGVSRLHGKVSREIFEPLFPHWPEDNVPVGYVTNGVHMPSWDSEASDNLWTAACGNLKWSGTTETLEKDIAKVPDEKIWQMRNDERRTLIDYTRERLTRDFAAAGVPPEQIEKAKHLFDPHTLTLGFARRFATYKRPNMLLQDPERLIRILSNAQRPVQLIIAGKAHPADIPGQNLIKEWTQFLRRPEVLGHVVFLSDYDMSITEQLVRGVDVWVNTPRRPWEACGTSGMKVLVNGGLNLSELDGWWVEAYTPEVGWAIGDGKEHGNDPAWDAAEALDLYNILEQQVIPEFYTRDSEGMPKDWLARIRASMSKLTPRFSANRAVTDYTKMYYIPGAEKYRQRTVDKGALGKKLVDWRHLLANKWSSIRFEDFKSEIKGDKIEFEALVYLDDLGPDCVRVELYADGIEGGPCVQLEMERVRQLAGGCCSFVFQASVPNSRPASDFTSRVVPYFPGAAVPLEASQILWQH